MAESNGTHVYDPEWVAFEKAMGPAQLPDTLKERTKAFNAALCFMAQKLPPTSEGITARDEQISPHVKARIYHPPNARGGKPLPCIVFCHGGGWIAGNLDTEDHICRTVCGEANCIVVSIDYRLHPEVNFPEPIEDCLLAYNWAYEHASTLGADPARFMIWGGSAGGTLALSVAYKLVSSGQRSRVNGVVLMAPMCLHPDACPAEYKHNHESYVENGGPVPLVTSEACMEAYVMSGALPPYKDSSWFPMALGSQAFSDFPPTYVINTELECMRDDGTVLEAELKDAGCKVKRDVMSALPHYFWSFPLEGASKSFRQKLVEGVKWVIANQ